MATSNADAVFELRPMNLADLLDAVIRLYRHNFGVVIRIAAVVFIPLGLIQIGSSVLVVTGMSPETGNPEFNPSTIAGIAGTAVYWLLMVLAMPIVQGAIAKAVAQSHLGETPDVWEAYRFVLRRWLRLIGVTLIFGLAQTLAVAIPLVPAGVLIGAALMQTGGDFPVLGVGAIVLGLLGALVALGLVTYLFVKLYFSALAVVLEDTGVFEALSRSWRLTDGHFIRVAITLLIVLGMTFAFTYIVAAPVQLGAMALQIISPAGGQALGGAVMVFTQLIVQPVQIVATVLLYYDLRIRKEGFDLVMMAETIGEPELATRTPQGEARPAGALYGTAQMQSPPPPPPSTPNGVADEPRDTDPIHGP